MKKKTLSRDGIDFPQEQTKNTHNPSFNSGQVQTTRIFKRKEKKGGGGGGWGGDTAYIVASEPWPRFSLKKHMI
jgi:hypothetical protein